MSLRNTRTGREFGDDMDETAKKTQAFMSKGLPGKIRVHAQNIVDESFAKEQYQDGKSSKWDDRKNDDESGKARSDRRALLVLSGDLISDVTAEQNGNDIIIGTDVKYAKRHNEGEGKTPQRQFMPVPGESNPVLDAAVEKDLNEFMDSILG